MHQPIHGTHQSTNLTYAISLVNDSIHGNTFKCVANFLGCFDTAFDDATATIESKLYSRHAQTIKFVMQFLNNLLTLASVNQVIQFHKLDSCTL